MRMKLTEIAPQEVTYTLTLELSTRELGYLRAIGGLKGTIARSIFPEQGPAQYALSAFLANFFELVLTENEE